MPALPWREIGIFAAIVVASLAVSLAITAAVLVRLPAGYFVQQKRSFMPDAGRPLRAVVLVLKNLLGYAVIAIGIAMSIPGVPGQGFLTILIGLMLVDFPGKYRVERWMIRRRAIRSAANWVRRKAGKPDFEKP